MWGRIFDYGVKKFGAGFVGIIEIIAYMSIALPAIILRNTSYWWLFLFIGSFWVILTVYVSEFWKAREFWYAMIFTFAKACIVVPLFVVIIGGA